MQDEKPGEPKQTRSDLEVVLVKKRTGDTFPGPLIDGIPQINIRQNLTGQLLRGAMF
jgi:hypothetical protein